MLLWTGAGDEAIGGGEGDDIKSRGGDDASEGAFSGNMNDDVSLTGEEMWLLDGGGEFRSCCGCGGDDEVDGNSGGEIDNRAAGGDGVKGNPRGDNDATRSGDDGIEILIKQ